MARKHANNYFDMLVHMEEYACKAALFLRQALEHYDLEQANVSLAKLHEIEHGCDQVKHDIRSKLEHEFITPIEREDIMLLAQEIDTVTDFIEDVFIRIRMYDIAQIRPAAIKMAQLIEQCCVSLGRALADLHNFNNKSSKILAYIVEVNDLEEQGDKLYFDSVHDLFRTCNDSVQVFAWTRIFDRLEQCCDACEHVANAVEGVVLKNA